MTSHTDQYRDRERMLDYLAEQDRRRNMAALFDRAARGERLTTRERADLAGAHVTRVLDEITTKLSANKMRAAFLVVLQEAAAQSIVQAEKRQELEDRVAALEAAAETRAAHEDRLAALEAAAEPLKAGKVRMKAPHALKVVHDAR